MIFVILIFFVKYAFHNVHRNLVLLIWLKYITLSAISQFFVVILVKRICLLVNILIKDNIYLNIILYHL